MDWRHNQLVGVGAAGLLILAIVGIFMWNSNSDDPAAGRYMTFQCKSTGNNFQVTMKEVDASAEAYSKYNGDFGVDTDCKLCDKKDALRVFHCPTCDTWYPYRAGQEMSSTITCAKGHVVSELTDL